MGTRYFLSILFVMLFSSSVLAQQEGLAELIGLGLKSTGIEVNHHPRQNSILIESPSVSISDPKENVEFYLMEFPGDLNQFQVFLRLALEYGTEELDNNALASVLMKQHASEVLSHATGELLSDDRLELIGPPIVDPNMKSLSFTFKPTDTELSASEAVLSLIYELRSRAKVLGSCQQVTSLQ